MTDLIVAWLNAVSQGATVDMKWALAAPAEYSPVVSAAMALLHDTVVKPLTAVILAIIASLSLATTSTRVEGDRELGTRIIAATMFKIVMVVLLCQNAPLILDAITQVSTWLSKTANGVDVGAGTPTNALGDSMRASIDAAGTMSQLVIIVMLLVPWLLVAAATAIASVLVVVRFLQLYVMSAFASLPLAFLAHEETKQIGVGYLKRFAVVALSGAVLVIVSKLYQALIGGISGSALTYTGGDVMSFLTSHFAGFLVGPVVLMFLLFGANNLAKSILGEG
ncbi:type IV secretion system protein [Microbacterium testaceum]|nr:type IV secretion system protein [Microbacterium testaceum]